MAKPTKEDAALLLQIYGIATSDEKYAKAASWYQYEMNEKSFEDFIKKYPIQSEAYKDFMVMMSYAELVGTLVVTEVLSEELVFEMWDFEMIWEKAKPIVIGLREQFKMPRFMENLEVTAKMHNEWVEKHPPKI